MFWRQILLIWRYLDKISYTISGEEELLQAEVPKLILQPIVENSIYHGIRPQKKMGRIDIRYRKEKDILIITVTDNGLGYDPKPQEDGTKIKTKLGGIGMQNVDQRIKILCGSDYGIAIANAEQGGAVVTYQIPLSQWKKREEDSKESHI